MTERNVLFVCGVPRSGTTALARLLNRHPKIALGIERYKSLALSARGQTDFDPSLFEKNRFFAFHDGDTNVRDPGEYAFLSEKFDDALWVGDKVPRYYMKYGALFERFPGSKVIFIVRDIEGVASSWNTRAENLRDTWPAGNDYAKAVAEWNVALHKTLGFKGKYQDRLLIVVYEDLFSGRRATLAKLIAQLGLTMDDDLQAYFEKTSSEWGQLAMRPPNKKPGQDDFIAQNADMQAFRAVLPLAISGASPS